ncbi:MAG: hypothetical protein R3284_00240, partial [Rubricoccaceae bacterium]|nr:hypothetical protein [Rubricoccaceae bacterium]
HHYNSFDALSDSLLQLTADGLQREEGYRMPFEVGTWVIEGLDSTSTTVLGTTANGLPNLIRVESGQGQFILSSEPLAFTNAALTGDGNGAEYLSGVLAYVPAQTVLWDAYYKPFAARPETPLASALDSPALSWSLLLIFAGVLLFILFRGRRWQRPVPVIMPPANATVDFVRTVGRLYFQHGDHRSLVERKRRYFFDRLRTRLALSDLDLSEETEQRVIGRSGVPKAQVAAVFNRFRRLQRHSQVSKDEILELDRWLDRFYEAVGT